VRQECVRRLTGRYALLRPDEFGFGGQGGAELGAAVMLHFVVNALFAIGVLLT